MQRYRGTEVNKSDGFLVIFDRVRDAVLFSLDYHQTMHLLSREHGELLEGMTLSGRIGIEWDDVIIRCSEAGRPRPGQAAGSRPGETPTDLEGNAKQVAARLMSGCAGPDACDQRAGRPRSKNDAARSRCARGAFAGLFMANTGCRA